MGADVYRLADVVLDQGEALVAEQVLDVRRAAGDEVVDAVDLVTLGEQPGAEMGADESGAAGDDGERLAHDASDPTAAGAAASACRRPSGEASVRPSDA